MYLNNITALALKRVTAGSRYVTVVVRISDPGFGQARRSEEIVAMVGPANSCVVCHDSIPFHKRSYCFLMYQSFLDGTKDSNLAGVLNEMRSRAGLCQSQLPPPTIQVVPLEHPLNSEKGSAGSNRPGSTYSREVSNSESHFRHPVRKIRKACRIIQAGSLSLTQSNFGCVRTLIDHAAHAKSQWICPSRDANDQFIVKLPWILRGIEFNRDNMD